LGPLSIEQRCHPETDGFYHVPQRIGTKLPERWGSGVSGEAGEGDPARQRAGEGQALKMGLQAGHRLGKEGLDRHSHL